MKTEKKKFRVTKEQEKIRQVTHWDLDYLPKEKILDLYQRETGYRKQKHKTAPATDESNRTIPLLLIAIGLLLLAGALCVASLT